MTGKHTPGPWRAEGFDVWTGHKGENRRVAFADHDMGDGVYKVRTEPEAVANARLIAAAPELLDVCEIALGVMAWARDNGGCAESLDAMQRMARAAIAKATGEEQ